MYSRVKVLRRHGERLSDHEIGAAPWHVGHLTIVLIEHVPVMKLHAAGDDSVMAPILPLMFRARVVSMHGDKMLFQGFERDERPDDKRRQEWTVQIMAEQPAEMARESHRPPQ